jgi:WS/DGAT/MGAT family acyltransferase
MERLSGLDATFLYLETPNNHMHVCATMVLDPSTVPGGYSFDKFKEVIRGRLDLVKPFRRRLVTVPFQLHHPLWIEDPDFDLDYHVRRLAAPAPGTDREFAEIAGEIASRPLDRSRPLWELWVVEGLENGHVGVVAKMHHSTIDGVSGANLMVHLFDMEPNPAPKEPPEEEWKPDRKPSDLELVGYAMQSRAKRPLQLAAVIPPTVKSVINVARGRLGGGGAGGAQGTPFAAPNTSFNGAITPYRKVAFANVPLDEVKMVKNAFGTTVNDVVLALCAGALRRYLDAHGEFPDKPLVATVPVSVRGDDEKQIGSNAVSAMFTSLATDIDDPVERLLAIHESTKDAKEEHKAVGADTLINLSEFAAPNLFGLAARLYSGMKLADRHRPVHNLVISNVPGPPFPLFFGGARLVAMNPLGPIFEGAGLNITVLSYLDAVGFGFMADRESLPGVWDLAAGVSEALEELKKAADTRSADTKETPKPS